MKRNFIQVIRLSEKEKQYLDILVKREGCSTPDYIRRTISDKYKKTFPVYIQEKSIRAKKQEFYQNLIKKPVEELCELYVKALGPRGTGGIEKYMGVTVCLRKRGSYSSTKPLEPKSILVDAVKEEYEDGNLELPI